MKSAILLFAAVLGVTAATPTPPLQPTTGPGGNDYPYGYAAFGPYEAAGQKTPAYSYQIYQPVGLAPSPANPNPLPAPATAPVILFLHGPDGDNTFAYLFWMGHMAQMGYTVVYVVYDEGTKAPSFYTTALTTFSSAMAKLKQPGFIPPTVDGSGNALTAYVGHSQGGYLAYIAAVEATKFSLPVPKAIVAIEPQLGTMTPANYSKIDPTTLVLTVVGDSNDTTDPPCDGANVWAEMTQIPTLFRPILQAHSDSHGTPNQIANHWFPLTFTIKDTDPPPITVDDRDFNITYKLSTAAANCAITGLNCDYALGNGPENYYGATTQTDMGLWSDGQPVAMLQLLTNPSTQLSCQ